MNLYTVIGNFNSLYCYVADPERDRSNPPPRFLISFANEKNWSQ